MNNYRERFVYAKSKWHILNSDLQKKQKRFEELDKLHTNLLTAKNLVLALIAQTQAVIKERMGHLVTLAVQSVFDDSYSFTLKDNAKKSEFRPVVLLNGEEYVPKDDLGAGMVPILDFAIRIVLMKMEVPRKRPILFMDEPTRGALGEDGDYLDKAINMYKEISEKLGFQLIVTTHSGLITRVAKTLYHFTKKNGISEVKQIRRGDYEKEEKASDGGSGRQLVH